jgi:hypothetical protein
MTPQPGGPTPQQPNETCRTAEARSTIVIRESGLPEKPVYQLIVNFDFCYKDGNVTWASVSSRTTPPADPRLTAISQTRTASKSDLGGPRYLNVQEVFFTGCGDLGNIASCRNYRHTVQVGVTGDGTLSTSANLAFFDGPLPPTSI